MPWADAGIGAQWASMADVIHSRAKPGLVSVSPVLLTSLPADQGGFIVPNPVTTHGVSLVCAPQPRVG